MPTPRGADGIGLGIGCGLAFGGRRIWTPASVPSLAAWYEARDVPAVLEPAVQPALVDGDMEAIGTAAWTGILSGVPTKEPGAHSGSQCLRVTGSGYAKQTVLVNGNTYRVKGWFRGDGAASPRVYLGSTVLVNGTSSNTWQYFDAIATSNSDYLALYTVIGAGSYAEFDDITIENLSRTRWTPTAGSLGGYLEQTTAAQQFWASTDTIGTHFAVEFDGTADHNVSSAAASAWPLHKAAGATVAFAFQPAAVGAGVDTIYDTCDGTATNHGVTIDYDTAAETLRVLVANGSGTFAVDDTVACATGVDHYVELFWSSAGYSLRVDGGVAVTGAITGALSASDATATLQQGRKSGGSDFYQGLLGETQIYLAGSATIAAKAGASIKAEYGL